jgi:hypothetical protein
MSGLPTTENHTIARGEALNDRPEPKTVKKFWGILRRKECWVISTRGWFLFATLFLAVSSALIFTIHSFLAVTDRVPTETLVVEGWINRYAIRGGVAEFKGGTYRQVFTTGGPENGSGGYVNDFQTSASDGAEELVKLGLSPQLVQMVPSRVIGRDRTYSAAVALREWFRSHHAQVQSFNVLTEDAHSRRTRLLYQEAFGDSVKVGVISVANPDYDAKRWWRYSEGVRQVISESTAYIYAKLFFWPSSE